MKKVKLFLPWLFLFFGFTFIAITSCSTSESVSKELLPYDNNQESLNKIGDNVESSDFYINKDLTLESIESKDISWKYASNYPQLKMIVTIEAKKDKDLIASLDKEVNNVVYFKFSLHDGINNLNYYSNSTYFSMVLNKFIAYLYFKFLVFWLILITINYF
ncbi:hypothetical protein [Mycoplasmoides alvi]|uniref:hypothetical protein n=1 Tax=Mycoplasmoides alvi TaxID=78580 RepID=UPI00051B62B4|nr:hypothetical protein [Mycoplasmoides alvi]